MTEMAKIEFLSAEVQQALLEEFSSVTLEAVTSAFGGVEKAQNVLEKSLGATKAREVIGRVARMRRTRRWLTNCATCRPSRLGRCCAANSRRPGR